MGLMDYLSGDEVAKFVGLHSEACAKYILDDRDNNLNANAERRLWKTPTQSLQSSRARLYGGEIARLSFGHRSNSRDAP